MHRVIENYPKSQSNVIRRQDDAYNLESVNQSGSGIR